MRLRGSVAHFEAESSAVGVIRRDDFIKLVFTGFFLKKVPLGLVTVDALQGTDKKNQIIEVSMVKYQLAYG